MEFPFFVFEHHRPFFFKNDSNYKPFWSAPFFLSMTDFHNPSYFQGYTQILLRRWIHWVCLYFRFVVFPIENHTFWYVDWFVILDHISWYHQNRSKTIVIISILGVPLFVFEHHRPFFFKNDSNCKPFWSAPFLLRQLIFTILDISKVILKFCYGENSLILWIFQICCISYRKLHILVRWRTRPFWPYFIFATRPC